MSSVIQFLPLFVAGFVNTTAARMGDDNHKSKFWARGTMLSLHRYLFERRFPNRSPAERPVSAMHALRLATNRVRSVENPG